MFLNYVSDKITNYLILKEKLNNRGSKEWSMLDYKIRCFLYTYGLLLFIIFVNIFTYSWLESISIYLLFNLQRNFTGGWHSKKLHLCFVISTIYFTILANITHLIIHSNNNILIYLCPLLATIGVIFNYYKYTPKLTKEEILKINNAYNKDPENVQSIKEMKSTYLKLVIILIAIMIIGYFIFCSKFILIVISFSLISVNIVISDIGEKYYFKLLEKIILIIENKIKILIKQIHNHIYN